MKNQYNRLKEVISAGTDVFDEIFGDMFLPEEIEIIERAGKEKFYAEQAAKWLEISVEQAKKLLEQGYCRGVFNKLPEKETTAYTTVTLYYYLDCFVLGDRQRWYQYPRSFIDAADAWYFGEYGKGVDERMATEDSKPSEIVLPLEDALSYIDNLPDHLYLLPCDCSSICAAQGHTQEVCIQCSEAAVNSMFDRGFGKKITKEEAKEIVRQCDNEGLIHSPTDYHFCNCGPEHCYPFRYSKIIESRRAWPKSFYVAQVDVDKCIGCKQCIKRCPVAAISLQDKKAVINETECVGCGVCRVPCKVDAITMRQVHPYSVGQSK